MRVKSPSLGLAPSNLIRLPPSVLRMFLERSHRKNLATEKAPEEDILSDSSQRRSLNACCENVQSYREQELQADRADSARILPEFLA